MSQTYRPNVPNEEAKDPGNRAIIGPALPPHLRCQSLKEDEESIAELSLLEENQQKEFQSEAHLTAPSESNKITKPQFEANYGPALPPHLQKIVPKVTHNDSESDEDYGPLPAGVPTKSLAQQALEERALQLKLDLLQGLKQDQAEAREEWMIELPAVGGAHLGLGPRQFRKNNRPDFSDRSSWTDTPEQKAKKSSGKVEDVVDLKKEAELREIAKRNKEKDKLVAEYNKKKKRDKSLVEMHQEKLKKKKMDDGETSTSRRPFNREIDLKINQFDDAQKKSIMRKAMHLDDRFSRGQSKYL